MLDSDFNTHFDKKKIIGKNVEAVKMGVNKTMVDCV